MTYMIKTPTEKDPIGVKKQSCPDGTVTWLRSTQHGSRHDQRNAQCGYCIQTLPASRCQGEIKAADKDDDQRDIQHDDTSQPQSKGWSPINPQGVDMPVQQTAWQRATSPALSQKSGIT
jgi:hypothetical protein